METQTATSEMKLAEVPVYSTTDYGMFHFLKGNRDLNKLKIDRIIDSVQNGLSFFQYCPIMVNKNGYVIDGQHRFYVCKKLGLPIYYVIVPNFTIRQVAEMNNNASRWTDNDFLNCYIDIGIDHYRVLKEFMESYRLKIGIACSLLSNGKVKGDHKDDFRDGLFKVNYLKNASMFMQHALNYKDYCIAYNSRNFLQALEILIKSNDYDSVGLIEKLKLHNLVIEIRQSPKEYLAQLEDLFNYHNQKRKRIY